MLPYQVYMLNEGHGDNFFVVISVDEINMVRKPTNSKNYHHHHEHFHNLEKKIILNLMAWFLSAFGQKEKLL